MIKAEWTNNDALSAEQTTQTNAPNTLNALDCISRQAAIERLKERRRIFCKNHIEFIILSENDKARVDEIDNCIATLKNLPSAQPDVTDRNVGDMIFRQDAIDVTWEKMTYTEQWYVLTEVRRRLKALPSAQPEQKRGKSDNG